MGNCRLTEWKINVQFHIARRLGENNYKIIKKRCKFKTSKLILITNYVFSDCRFNKKKIIARYKNLARRQVTHKTLFKLLSAKSITL